MKKSTAVITCGGIIAGKYFDALADCFKLRALGCSISADKITHELKEAVGLIIGGADLITLAVLVRNPSIKWIIFIGIQPQTFFTPDAWRYCQEHGIPVYATGGGGMAVARTTANQITDYLGDSLADKEVSVIGSGGIGTEVLKLLSGRTKKLSYWSRQEKLELSGLGFNYVPVMADAFYADAVTLHLALVPETENIVGIGELTQVNPLGLFVNNARAGLVRADDFLDFLEVRRDVYSVWDVFWAEGSQYERLLRDRYNPLWAEIAGQENFMYTRHQAAMSAETAEEYGRNLMKIIEEKGLGIN